MDEIDILRLELEETRRSSMETEASFPEELQRIKDEKESVIPILKQ